MGNKKYLYFQWNFWLHDSVGRGDIYFIFPGILKKTLNYWDLNLINLRIKTSLIEHMKLQVLSKGKELIKWLQKFC